MMWTLHIEITIVLLCIWGSYTPCCRCRKKRLVIYMYLMRRRVVRWVALNWRIALKTCIILINFAWKWRNWARPWLGPIFPMNIHMSSQSLCCSESSLAKNTLIGPAGTRILIGSVGNFLFVTWALRVFIMLVWFHDKTCKILTWNSGMMLSEQGRLGGDVGIL